jgi:hypothetical protein
MKNNRTAIYGLQEARLQIDKVVAYHLAGHAVAICLGNNQKQLPDVHFQILIDRQGLVERPTGTFAAKLGNTSIIAGGRLIQHLPLSLAEALQGLADQQQQDEYKRAFEADIIRPFG